MQDNKNKGKKKSSKENHTKFVTLKIIVNINSLHCTLTNKGQNSTIKIKECFSLALRNYRITNSC